ncbi:MAG: cytochrome c oxidase subunit [Actinomycetota bacterium]|jgi:cytochrome c oxidase subunit 1|nr:cytochrome c oxidase subunit [Actinomycetota bacterium]
MATAAISQRRLFARPTSTTGWKSWLFTVDHKKIGILYGATAFIFFILGGLEAVAMRTQLARPDQTLFGSAEQTADLYNQFMTMHGVTMIFLVVMPMGVALFNFFVPLMIGARDVAFPRLNALSYWIFAFGGIFLYSSFFLGGAPDGGWFGYAPLSTTQASNGMSYYSVGLQILGVASLLGAINFIVTILNMRAPGMTMMRMPVFIWMTLVVSFLLLFAMPVIAVALFQLMFDRLFDTNFFNPAAGGDPVLWQHLFWLFGHPEVYILILPAMGIVSEIIPVFSRKPLFGYAAIVFAGAAIGFMGWGVWAHHMFAVGLGPVANSAFAISTMFIAVPTGVKIFNWLGTMWGGDIRFKTPMLFAIGFVMMFIIGGLSGVTHSIVPHDAQQTDTYYIVAHFHYVLFGGALFGIMAGLYYWWPKVFGHMLSEKLGKLHFWLWFIGFNVTFAPFHIVGLQGMPRRIYTYPKGMGWDVWNLVETIGAFIIVSSVLVFIANIIVSSRKREEAVDDPWDARTLEWSIPSPPPEYNFAEVPVVTHRDDWWHRKYVESPEGFPVPVLAGGSKGEENLGDGHGIHLPSPSFFPLVVAAGLPVMGYGVIYFNPLVLGLGALITMMGVFGWIFEPGAADEH